LIALSTLIHALQLPQSGVEDWLVFEGRHDLAAMDVVLTGTIAALDLDRNEVASDAAWALAQLSNTSQTMGDVTALLSTGGHKLVPSF